MSRVTHEKFIRGSSALRSKPLPFYIPFLTGKVTLSYTFHSKWYPFHIPTVETLQLSLAGLFAIFYKPLNM